jgi:hypothetical protein
MDKMQISKAQGREWILQPVRSVKGGYRRRETGCEMRISDRWLRMSRDGRRKEGREDGNWSELLVT